MGYSVRHIALMVGDLRSAEAYYQTLFEMELIGREAPGKDGLWYTLPFDKDWEDAEAAGITLGMVGLRRDAFVLALFAGQAVTGQVFVIGLTMSEEAITGLQDRLPDDVQVMEKGADSLTFRDGYQIMWQISTPGQPFVTAGESGRWLEVQDAP